MVLGRGPEFAAAPGRLARSGDADVSPVLVQSITDPDDPQHKGVFLGADLLAWLARAGASLDIDQYVYHDCGDDEDGSQAPERAAERRRGDDSPPLSRRFRRPGGAVSPAGRRQEGGTLSSAGRRQVPSSRNMTPLYGPGLTGGDPSPARPRRLSGIHPASTATGKTMIHDGHSDHARPRPTGHTARITLVVASAATLCAGVLLPATAVPTLPGHATATPTAAPPAAQPGAPLPASLTGQRPAWRSCRAPTALQASDAEAPKALPDGTSWECAALKVPLDYADPGGDTITLALIRARARPGHGQRRIGSLVFNFGGPGASGVAGLPQLSGQYAALHTRYDLVSLDPRGVGASAPVRCLDDKDTETLDQSDGTPKNDKEAQALLALSDKYLPDCLRHSGKVLAHVGTVDAARDLDLLRQVLGDDRLN
ncbi:alpha/beta fold hydrolase [Streptomyces dangxiongensis]|uniref:alpha/beta fold hydrolase n=1 Tax=Streptomyces dangxiongensis TaxID=1442032 RepID=UPI001F09F644|nr:alpha/beta fold hydrolase [Streptomyces dangxiongensis]